MTGIKTAAVRCMAAVLACVPSVADANDQALGRALLVCAEDADDALRLRCVDRLIASLRVEFAPNVNLSPPAERPAMAIAVEAPVAEAAIEVPNTQEVEPASTATAKPQPACKRLPGPKETLVLRVGQRRGLAPDRGTNLARHQ